MQPSSSSSSSVPPVLHLQTIDLAVCVIFLIITIAVGLTSGKKKKKLVETRKTNRQEDGEEEDDYFTGGRQQSCFLVAISLLSGLTSGISYLGCPGLAFETGAIQVFFQIGGLCAIPLITQILIPFYHRSGVTTLYGYLDLRFGNVVRRVASIIFIVRTVMYLSIVLVAPSIVVKIFNVNQQIFIIVCGTCSTLYTAKGGLASVLSTDALQSVALTVIVVVVFTSCWSNTIASHESIDTRLEESQYWGIGLYSPPALTVWSGLIGGFTAVAAQAGADQIAVQRYLSVNTCQEAQKSAAIGVATSFLFTSFQIMTGVLLYTFYRGKQPVESSDAILPFYVGSEMQSGAAGACLAALTGCTMSVLSGGMNSIVTVGVFDLLGRDSTTMTTSTSIAGSTVTSTSLTPPTSSTSSTTTTITTTTQGSPLTSVWASKILTLVVGVVVTTTSYWLSFGSFQLVELSNRVLGSMSGPLLGLFILAICVPTSERIGALTGLTVAFVLAIMSATAETTSVLAISAFMISPVLTSVTVAVGWLVSFLLISFNVGFVENKAVRTRRRKGLTLFDVAEQKYEKLSLSEEEEEEHGNGNKDVEGSHDELGNKVE
jgi:Na+/proline symporter